MGNPTCAGPHAGPASAPALPKRRGAADVVKDEGKTSPVISKWSRGCTARLRTPRAPSKAAPAQRCSRGCPENKCRGRLQPPLKKAPWAAGICLRHSLQPGVICNGGKRGFSGVGWCPGAVGASSGWSAAGMHQCLRQTGFQQHYWCLGTSFGARRLARITHQTRKTCFGTVCSCRTMVTLHVSSVTDQII